MGSDRHPMGSDRHRDADAGYRRFRDAISFETQMRVHSTGQNVLVVLLNASCMLKAKGEPNSHNHYIQSVRWNLRATSSSIEKAMSRMQQVPYFPARVSFFIWHRITTKFIITAKRYACYTINSFCTTHSGSSLPKFPLETD